eukprot:90204-Rhodomonas_salina.1
MEAERMPCLFHHKMNYDGTAQQSTDNSQPAEEAPSHCRTASCHCCRACCHLTVADVFRAVCSLLKVFAMASE